MKRRNFLQLAAASTMMLPSLMKAQQPDGIVRVGWMSAAQPTANDANMSAFFRGMREFGYVEKQNFALESRFGDGKSALMQDQALELERLGVAVIVAGPFAALQAAKQSTTSTPIIMTPAADPVAVGIVKSLDHPGENITGITEMMPELTPDRIRLMKQIMPMLSRVAILFGPGMLDEGVFARTIEQSLAVAGPLGIQIQLVPASKVQDFDAAFTAMEKESAEALIVLINPVFFGQRIDIIERAAKQRLPAMYEWKPFVQAGGLISYGADVPDIYRRAAGIAVKIIKGTKPGDIPVGRPELFNIGLNLKTAQALGLAIPDHIRQQAVEVIE